MVEVTAEVVPDRQSVPLGIAQTAGAPRRGGHVETEPRLGGDRHLAKHQPAVMTIDKLGPHPAIALGKTQVVELQGRHNFAGVSKEQAPPQPGHLKQQVSQDVAADISIAKQLPQHRQHRPIEPQHPQKFPERGGTVALQQWQQQGRGTKTRLAGAAHIRIAMESSEGQLVVLHGVDLATQQIGGEVEAARHRQARILQPVSHLLRQQQAVGACVDHHMAGPQPGPGPFRRARSQLHSVEVALGFDLGDAGAKAHVDDTI